MKMPPVKGKEPTCHFDQFFHTRGYRLLSSAQRVNDNFINLKIVKFLLDNRGQTGAIIPPIFHV